MGEFNFWIVACHLPRDIAIAWATMCSFMVAFESHNGRNFALRINCNRMTTKYHDSCGTQPKLCNTL